eukprot:sb/3466331/
MEPEINKLISFYHFFDRAKDKFVKEIRDLCHPQRVNKDFISETHLVTLGQMINMFVVLDQLKDIKASIPNDFTHFKRIFSLRKETATEDRNNLYQKLTTFLAMRRFIMDRMYDELSKIERFEEVLADIVNTAAKRFEQGWYMTPKEKHMLLKVVAFGLFLIDGPSTVVRDKKNQVVAFGLFLIDGPSTVVRDKKNQVFSRLLKMNDKSISIQRFDKLFKTLPVVPLYGDMQIKLYMCPKEQKFCSYELDPGKWTCVSKDVVKVSTTQFNIVTKLETMRSVYENLTAKLMSMSSRVAVVAFGLFLIDGPSTVVRDKKNQVFSRLLKMNDKSISIQRFDKLFKVRL